MLTSVKASRTAPAPRAHMADPYRSAIKRLKELCGAGAFFSGAEMGAFFGFSQAVARQTLHRWARQGLITPIGPRADVYLNTLHPDHAAAVEMAVQSVHRSAIVIGHQILYEAGITTQVPPVIDIAVQKRGPSIYGYRIHKLSTAAYAALARHAKHETGRLARLAPEQALAAASKLGCLTLDPDDLDWPEAAAVGTPSATS